MFACHAGGGNRTSCSANSASAAADVAVAEVCSCTSTGSLPPGPPLTTAPAPPPAAMPSWEAAERAAGAGRGHLGDRAASTARPSATTPRGSVRAPVTGCPAKPPRRFARPALAPALGPRLPADACGTLMPCSAPGAAAVSWEPCATTTTSPRASRAASRTNRVRACSICTATRPRHRPGSRGACAWARCGGASAIGTRAGDSWHRGLGSQWRGLRLGGCGNAGRHRVGVQTTGG